MNPESQIPQPSPESGCGVPPQTVPGASRSESALSVFDSMGFVDSPETHAEPDFDDDNEDARNYDLMLDDLAAANDDFARSDEDGWFYSDED